MSETIPTRETVPSNEAVTPQRRRRRGRLLAVLITLVVIAVIVVVLVALNGGTNVSYRASIVSMQPVNSAAVKVGVQVTNTGSGSGTPACTVNAKSPNGAYMGEGVLTAQQALPQGDRTTLHGTITVTHKGARNVTPAASSLNCA
jgi:predicted nucleic acid-binding Zn ribbon protein